MNVTILLKASGGMTAHQRIDLSGVDPKLARRLKRDFLTHRSVNGREPQRQVSAYPYQDEAGQARILLVNFEHVVLVL